jgi:membrane-bound lytic murein transglycosylase D
MWRWLLLALVVSPLAHGAPLPEDSQGRRAIRGAPVEAAHEPDSLRLLRQLDEESFPRPDAPTTYAPDTAAGVHAGSSGGGVGPDALPPALRSPDRAAQAAETVAAIPWLNQIKLPDLPVRFDPRVLRYLELYKNDKRGRAIMAGWLKAQGRWRPMFEAALRKAKLPASLIYVSMIESGYDPHDRSHAGAVGLWQFMPEGAKIYGLRVDYWVDERKNPEKATEAFTHYITDLKERFGSWPLALAAFNAGYGAVLRSMQKYNTNDYWELCRHEDGLPWDTMLYVPKAMAAAIVGENRSLFGYDDVGSDPAFGFDRVSVPSSMSLATIARSAGVSVSEVELLNPELRRKRTPPDVDRWEVRVPKGTGPRFAQAYGANKELVKPFVVRFGERLDDLAREFGTTARELRTLNGIDDLTEVRPGLTIVVPDGRKPALPTLGDTVIVAVPDKDAVVAGRKRVFYRTLPTDSIQDVSVFFRVKPADLTRWNNLDLDARLCGGMVLQVWVPNELDTTKVALVDPSLVRVVTTGSEEFFDLVEAKRGRARLVYTVKKGDDLKKIGKKYGLTVADLERINRFGAKHTDLAVGQRLIVYRAMTAQEREKAAGKLTPGGTDARPQEPPVGDPAVDENLPVESSKPAEKEAPPPDARATPPREEESPESPAGATSPLPLHQLPRLPAAGKVSAARP